MAVFLGGVCTYVEGSIGYCRGKQGLFSSLYAGVYK